MEPATGDELDRLRAQRRAELLAKVSGATHTGPRELGTHAFDAYLREQPLAMVDFWAAWCGPCRLMEPLVEALSREWRGKVAVAKVNADAYPDLLARYRIMGIPTFLFFRHGELVGRLVGAQPRAEFSRVVADLAKGNGR